MGKLVWLIVGSVVIARMVELTVFALRRDHKVEWQRQLFERLKRLRNGSLFLVLVWCSACATTRPAMHATTRTERAAARTTREAKLIEMAKLHPNARPRERPSCPEFTPTGALPNCPAGMKRGKPWL